MPYQSLRQMFLVVIAAVLLLPFGVQSADTGGPIVALFDMEDKGSGLKGDGLNNLIDYLAARLTEGGYQVVPQEQVRERIKAAQADTHKACFEQSCQVELGREMAAQKTLATKILRFGDTCQVTAVLYDLRKATTESAATAEGLCDINKLLVAVKEIATKLCAPLQKGKRAAEAAEIEGMMKERSTPGTLVVKTFPMGAQIHVDGQSMGISPLTLKLGGSQHKVVAMLYGYNDTVSQTSLNPGTQTDVTLSLNPGTSSLEVSQSKPSSSSRTWTHLCFWPGLGALGFSGLALTQAMKYGGDAAKVEDSKTWGGMFWVSAGMGALLVSTGIYLWVSSPSAPQPSAVATGPSADGQGWVVSYQGLW